MPVFCLFCLFTSRKNLHAPRKRAAFDMDCTLLWLPHRDTQLWVAATYFFVQSLSANARVRREGVLDVLEESFLEITCTKFSCPAKKYLHTEKHTPFRMDFKNNVKKCMQNLLFLMAIFAKSFFFHFKNYLLWNYIKRDTVYNINDNKR